MNIKNMRFRLFVLFLIFMSENFIFRSEKIFKQEKISNTCLRKNYSDQKYACSIYRLKISNQLFKIFSVISKNYRNIYLLSDFYGIQGKYASDRIEFFIKYYKYMCKWCVQI